MQLLSLHLFCQKFVLVYKSHEKARTKDLVLSIDTPVEYVEPHPTAFLRFHN